MADLIAVDATTGNWSFAYSERGGPGWHNKGQLVPNGASEEEWAKAAGFGYDIELGKVWLEFENENGEEDHKVIEQKFMPYHSITKEPFGVLVGKDWRPHIQPREIIGLMREIFGHMGFEIDTAGALRGGAVFFATAFTGEELRIGGRLSKDIHRQYVGITTSANKMYASTTMLTAQRIVCDNTLRLAHDLKDNVKVRRIHTQDFDPDLIKEELQVIDYRLSWERYKGNLEALKEVGVEEGDVREFYGELLTGKPAKKEGLGEAEELIMGAYKKIEGEKKEREIKGMGNLWESYMEAPGAQPGTAYGVLQGVTHYVDHNRGKEGEKRAYSSMFAQGATLKVRAYEELCELCGIGKEEWGDE